MPNEKIRVLIVNVIPTHFKEMFRVASLLQNSSHYFPIFYFQREYAGVEKDIFLCEANNIVYKKNFALNNTALSNSTFALSPAFILKKIFNAFAAIKLPNIIPKYLTANAAKLMMYIYGKIWESNIFSKLPGIRRIKEQYVFIQQIIQDNHIQLIILPEDNIFYLSPIYLNFAHEKKIPVVVVPFTIANASELAETFYSFSIYYADRLINKWITSLYPSWAMPYKGKTLVLPLQYILAYEYLKIAPERPWVLNGNNISALMVENPAMYQYYLQSEIAEDKLRLTGALYDDELYHASLQKNQAQLAFCKKYHCSLEKPILLCALPSNQFQLNRPYLEFTHYDELITYLLKTLQQYANEFTIVVNLHPRSVINTNILAEHTNIILASEDVTALIPLSNLYVAFCSATIRMAIAMGIPVLNYDVYHYDYNDFKLVTGVVETGQKTGFEALLIKLCQDQHFFTDLKTKQAEMAKQWSMLDGKSGERILNELNSILLRKK